MWFHSPEDCAKVANLLQRMTSGDLASLAAPSLCAPQHMRCEAKCTVSIPASAYSRRLSDACTWYCRLRLERRSSAQPSPVAAQPRVRRLQRRPLQMAAGMAGTTASGTRPPLPCRCMLHIGRFAKSPCIVAVIICLHNDRGLHRCAQHALVRPPGSRANAGVA